ncbi:OprD family outer membrane porin [Simiduia agarivorans]|uniref:Outer membrane porin n=1 Tax=Simiduia agarivorans (strain DSM 21679 / JCM 13881 / BCRC 17597 / SA1) TaxID=1117647 RepID=K4KE69_SIMAS|nr:OprD family outer membrane porin [Simiduia agarivorans]AFU97334.1 hypothetical protein M5M_00485 [Simiduia agarivorans SA1 = DSM 21679]
MIRKTATLPCSLFAALTLSMASQADVPENFKDILDDSIDLESAQSATKPVHWELKLRNIYFNKDRDETGAGTTIIDQWGQAAELNYFNGSFSEHLDVGASIYGAIKLRGGDDNRSTDIFEKLPDGTMDTGYGKIGQLFARVKYNDANYLAAGASTLEYLTLESSGSRATPSSFLHQAIHFGQGHWQAYAMHTDRWSARHAGDYTRFTNNAGDQIDNLVLVGARYSNQQLYLNAETGESKDYLKRMHLSGGYRFAIDNGDHLELKVTYLTAVDAGHLYDSTFGERTAGTGLDGKKASISMEYQSDDIDFGVMLSRNGDDGFDHYWYSEDHGAMVHWNKRQISEFVAANEKVFHAQFNQKIIDSLPGLQWGLSFTHGSDARASQDFQSDPNNPNLEGTEWEVDLALRYDFSDAGMPGLNLTFISGYYRNNINEYDIWNNKNLRSNANATDHRVYLDYVLAF